MKTVGLFLPSEAAMRLSTQIEQIQNLAAPGPLRDLAAQAIDTLQSGDVGEYQVCATGPTGSGDQRSDLVTYRRNVERRRALGDHHRAIMDRVEQWGECYPKGSLIYDHKTK